MSDIASGPDADQPKTKKARFPYLPVTVALVLIAAVWVGACVISFTEQIRLAERYQFEMAWLFPLIFDGLASALAVTSWSAALDGRHSPLLRLVTCGAVSGSAWVNAAAVEARTVGALDWTQVGMAVAAPISAWVAFEFLLGELRRTIMRKRGEPAPPPVPALRLVRVLLAPARAVREWRSLTLDVTDPRHMVRRADNAPADNAPADNGKEDNRRAVLPPLVPVQMSAPGQTSKEAMSAQGRAGNLPQVSAPDTVNAKVGDVPRPPLSAPATVPAPDNRQADKAPADNAPAAAGRADSSKADNRRADNRADNRADKMSVSAAVTLLMRQGVTEPDDLVARVPDLVGREVPRATVTRTLRRQRAATSTDTHTGNYL